MRFNDIAPATLRTESDDQLDRRIHSLSNQRATLKEKIRAAADNGDEQTVEQLSENLHRLTEMLEAMMESRSPRQALEHKLKQKKAEYDDLPKNPQTQAGYDALDDLRDEIAELEKELKSLNENARDADEAYEEAKMRATVAISALQDQIAKFTRAQKRNSRNWGYAGTMESVASKLEDLVVYFGN